MDYYVHECHKKVYFASQTISVDEQMPVSPHKFQDSFKFFCQQKYRNWILRQDSTELEFLSEVEEPLVTKLIQYSTDKSSLSKNQLHRRLFRELSDLSMSSSKSYKVSKKLSAAAWDTCTESRGFNLKIDLNFVVVHNHIFDENRAIHLATQQSMQQLTPAMVPATDASIESLMSSCQVMDCSGGSCTICLEDFEAAGCPQVAMPCSHVFHQDCIQTWLKTSHYCPLCRYEMPTN